MGNLTGYFGAAPIWFDIMETAHAGLGIEPFVPPAGIIQAEVCIDTGTLPSPACAGRTYVEIFANTAPPPGPEQGIFQTLQVDSFTGKLANEACADALETRTYLVLNDRWAYDWLNNDPAGQAWLAQHGLQAPLEQPRLLLRTRRKIPPSRALFRFSAPSRWLASTGTKFATGSGTNQPPLARR